LALHPAAPQTPSTPGSKQINNHVLLISPAPWDVIIRFSGLQFYLTAGVKTKQRNLQEKMDHYCELCTLVEFARTSM